jgi:hypothetical protein
MARTITLKFPGKCADCGAALEVGASAVWYGRGRVYGRGCHEDTRPAGERGQGRTRRTATGGGRKLVWWGGKQVPGTRCEDAPCCGCCGPGSDDPAYHEADPYDGGGY